MSIKLDDEFHMGKRPQKRNKFLRHNKSYYDKDLAKEREKEKARRKARRRNRRR